MSSYKKGKIRKEKKNTTHFIRELNPTQGWHKSKTKQEDVERYFSVDEEIAKFFGKS